MSDHKPTLLFSILTAFTLLLGACSPTANTRPPSEINTLNPSGLKVIAAEAFLADIAQQVAGDRLVVETLIPKGVDPHSYQPTPADIARLSTTQVMIINGAGLEESLEDLFANQESGLLLVEASAGLVSRDVEDGEPGADEHAGDPHFWLDPNLVIQYAHNISLALSQADPAGAEIYAQNAQAYTARLEELDRWIQAQVAQVPSERRLLVTNHESFGYYADRYGFTIIGTIIPSVATGASPSAQQMAALIDQIRAAGAPAIFLETGANRRLADQIAQETGVKVAPDLHSHSPAGADPSGGYIEMMKYNTQVIVEALK